MIRCKLITLKCVLVNYNLIDDFISNFTVLFIILFAKLIKKAEIMLIVSYLKCLNLFKFLKINFLFFI